MTCQLVEKDFNIPISVPAFPEHSPGSSQPLWHPRLQLAGTPTLVQIEKIPFLPLVPSPHFTETGERGLLPILEV